MGRGGGGERRSRDTGGGFVAEMWVIGCAEDWGVVMRSRAEFVGITGLVMVDGVV